MTRVVVAEAYGGPEHLAVREIDDPALGPQDVLIDVLSAAVNPIDWKMYSGAMGARPDRLPMRLGLEVAGRVRALGAHAGSVRGLVIGDPVLANNVTGGYAELVAVRAQDVFLRPAALSADAGSSLLLAGGTASHLVETTHVGPGDTVLVHGGSGSVGQLVIQLARLRGARVLATASESAAALVESLGAEHLSYAGDLVAAVRDLSASGVNVALDTVGTDQALDTSVELVADRQRIATIAGFARAPELGIQLLGNGPGADPGTELRAAARHDLIVYAAAHQLTITIAATFPLERVADAHRLSMGGHARGKIILKP